MYSIFYCSLLIYFYHCVCGQAHVYCGAPVGCHRITSRNPFSPALQRQSLSWSCFVVHSGLAGPWASRESSCFCSLSHCRSTGITKACHHIWLFVHGFQGSNSGHQSYTAGTFTCWPILLALIIVLTYAASMCKPSCTQS